MFAFNEMSVNNKCIMAFHGFTEADIQYGRNALNHYSNKIDEDATASDLIDISERFSRDRYPGVNRSEMEVVVREVAKLAIQQLHAAQELGLSRDAQEYGTVVVRTEQQLWILSAADRHSREYVPFTNDQKATYDELLSSRPNDTAF